MSADRSPFQIGQARASHLLLLCATAMLPIAVGGAWFAGTHLFVAASMSGAFVALGWLASKSDEATARIGTALAVIGQPIALTAAFGGHAWQLDMHMSFFAALAAMILLTDARAIIVAASVTVIHHLSLSFLLPTLIYPSAALSENIARSMLHGAMVAVEAAALVGAISRRLHQLSVAEKREADLAAAQGEAVAAIARAESALVDARREGARADALRLEAEAAQRETLAESKRADEANRSRAEAESHEMDLRAEVVAAQQSVVTTLRSALGHLADGDLSTEITTVFPPEYEDLRTDFNLAVETLCRAVAQVTEVSGEIRGEAGAINAAAGDLAMRTEQQAATLEQTSAAMTEFTNSVQQSAKMAADAESSTSRARSQAMESGIIVQNAVKSMQQIAESSQKIAKINSVIDEIAFQTNLLALNAGVEAARAGDAGRGFAVVAYEVRALSQRCSGAAKEITGLVQEAGLYVKQGVDLVGQTGEALTEIIASVTSAAEKVAAIARTARDQAQSLGEMNSAIADLDRVTQQNASMFEETTAACQSLDTAMGGMLTLVAGFQVVKPKAETPPARARRSA